MMVAPLGAVWRRVRLGGYWGHRLHDGVRRARAQHSSGGRPALQLVRFNR